ncbi:MAG TPA: OmpA family protein, partial [Methylococcales bacterium]
MHKGILRIAIVLSAALLNMVAAQASDYKGGYIGGKFGINNSSASGAINAPSASTFAYGVQGGYLQGGYNWDVSAATIGVGAYADFNSYEKHQNGVEYGSRAYGMDAKLGLPAGDWLPYGKIGYGYSTGTRDLGAVANKSLNYAIGVEYKLVSRLGAIVEYKRDSFSSKDGSITIKNATLSFGLNYYFDRPEVAPIIAVSVPELEQQLGLPEPELDIDIASEPPPDIGSSIVSSTNIQSDPESWKTLLENNTVRVEGSRFVSGTVTLESGVVSGSVMLMPGDIKELKEVVGFAVKYPGSKLELIGYSDNIGSEEFNQMQSLARAESVKKYLVKAGVAANRISTKGEGSANPVGDNNTYEGRTINRHVEIRAVVAKQEKESSAKSTPKSAPAPASVPVPAAITASPAAKSVPEVWKILLEDKPVLVNIEGTSFVSGSETPNSKVGKELDEVAGFASKYPGTMLELVGYADSRGSEMLNLKLSLARAESIKTYLVKKGVAADRITTRGEGST